MPDQQHIQWILEGVESWNKRRETQNFSPNLEGADIPRIFGKARNHRYGLSEPVPLTEINLSSSNLRNASFEGADLSKARFVSAEMYGTNLMLANLTDANLWDAKLDEDTNLYATNLTYANLSNTNFGKSILYKQTADEITPKRVTKCEGVESAISSIGGLLEICEQLHTHYEGYPDDAFFLYYRGEERNTWDLKASVMRGANIPPEGEMLLDLISRQPQAFHNTPLAVEQWILAQHHTLKTRLLDITKSPLVALFNSCQKEPEKDGAFHIFAIPKSLVKPFTSDAVSIIANFAKLPGYEQEVLVGEGKSLAAGLGYRRAIRRLYHLIRHEKPFFEERINPRDLFRIYVIEPRQSFDRIRAQAGAFLISAYHRQFEPKTISDFNRGIPIYNHYKLTIPSGSKNPIMRDLERIHMTRETLFPGLDESAMAVNRRFL